MELLQEEVVVETIVDAIIVARTPTNVRIFCCY